MQFGIAQGWWEAHDAKGPIRTWYIDGDTWEGRFMSQLLAKLGLFKSVGDARKAGHVQKISRGVVGLMKGRERLVIE